MISVDSKNRDLVGGFKAIGRRYGPTGRPVEGPPPPLQGERSWCTRHYGVLDLEANAGLVSAGVGNDTERVRGQLDPRLVAASRRQALLHGDVPDDHC